MFRYPSKELEVSCPHIYSEVDDPIYSVIKAIELEEKEEEKEEKEEKEENKEEEEEKDEGMETYDIPTSWPQQDRAFSLSKCEAYSCSSAGGRVEMDWPSHVERVSYANMEGYYANTP